MGTDPLPTAAASRVYYALFQVAISELMEAGKTPQSFSSSDQWRHGMVANNLKAAPRLRSSRTIRHLYKMLQSSREVADYGPGWVLAKDVQDHFVGLKNAFEQLGITP